MMFFGVSRQMWSTGLFEENHLAIRLIWKHAEVSQGPAGGVAVPSVVLPESQHAKGADSRATLLRLSVLAVTETLRVRPQGKGLNPGVR